MRGRLTFDDDEDVRIHFAQNAVAHLEGGLVPILRGLAPARHSPHGVKEQIAPDLVVQVRTYDPLIGLVAIDHEQPVRLPLRRGLHLVPTGVLIKAATPDTLDGHVVQDDGNVGVRQGLDHSVEDLKRRHPMELWVCHDPSIGHGRSIVNHLIREWQSDGIDAQFEERIDDLGDWDSV